MMSWTVANALYYAVALFVVLAALSVAPAQLAARSLLRIVAGHPSSRSHAPALVLGLAVGAAGAIALAGAMIGPSATLLIALLLVLTLLAIIDITWRWLPLEWCGLIAVIGATQAILTHSYEPAALGALLGGGLLFALRTTYLYVRGIEALGLGDVWLTAALGGLVGPKYIIWLIGAAAVLGLLLHFSSLARSRPERGVAFGAHLSAVTPFFVGL